MDLVSQISAYEAGELDTDDGLALFGELVRSGMAWQLQGTYGRTAQALIDGGALSPTGEVLIRA